MEIDKQLGAVLADLGLRYKLVSFDEEYQLFFQRTDSSGVVWRSPISFVFLSKDESGEDVASWENARISLEESSIHPVGTNGWIQYAGGWSQEGWEMTDGYKKNAFRRAAKGLRKYPLVPQSYGLDMIVDGIMGGYWPDLERICRRHGIEAVNVRRDERGKEGYEFEHQGSHFKLLFDFPRIDVIKDGVTTDTVLGDNIDDLMKALQWQFNEMEHGSEDVPLL